VRASVTRSPLRIKGVAQADAAGVTRFLAAFRRTLPRVNEPAIFRLELRVADDDIDALGHANNVTFVRWIQEVALAHSAAVGFDLAAYQRLGGAFVVVRHEVDYVRPALRDDVLEARTWLSSMMTAKCLRCTELARKDDGQLLAKAVTSWGFIELATGRPKRIADEVRAAFNDYIRLAP
jgi:acyl-CoA thioester hydrolase